MLKILSILLLFVLPVDTSSITEIIHFSGRGCSICGEPDGQYVCSGLYNWNDGITTFNDHLPSGNVITAIDVYLSGLWGCGNITSIVSISLQGTTLGTFTVDGSCACSTCNPYIHYFWREFGQCFPNYNYGGNNTVKIDVIQGGICTDRMDIVLTYSIGNNNLCRCGNLGHCLVGQMRCVDGHSFQTCILDDNSESALWGPIEICPDTFVCNTTGDFVFCTEPVIAEMCSPGERMCVDIDTYQVCARNLNGNTYWQELQLCPNGYICNPDPTRNSIFCVPLHAINNTENCQFRSMRCVTENNYQMCWNNNGTGVWNPVQKCPEEQICIPNGDIIYCAPNIPNENCGYRNMQCLSSNTYRICNRHPDGQTFWDTEQECRDGFTCHQEGNNIYCY